MFVLDLNVVYCLHQEIPFHTQPQTCKSVRIIMLKKRH